MARPLRLGLVGLGGGSGCDQCASILGKRPFLLANKLGGNGEVIDGAALMASATAECLDQADLFLRDLEAQAHLRAPLPGCGLRRGICGLLAEHLPRDIGSQVFAADSTVGGALDDRAVLGGKIPIRVEPGRDRASVLVAKEPCHCGLPAHKGGSTAQGFFRGEGVCAHAHSLIYLDLGCQTKLDRPSPKGVASAYAEN